MDGSLHICNKNNHTLITKELKHLPIKSASLPLPPIIGEDEVSLKIGYIQNAAKEKTLKQEQEREKRDTEKKRLSLARQAFHKEHGRYATFSDTPDDM
jgi:hypothetical protein